MTILAIKRSSLRRNILKMKLDVGSCLVTLCTWRKCDEAFLCVCETDASCRSSLGIQVLWPWTLRSCLSAPLSPGMSLRLGILGDAGEGTPQWCPSLTMRVQTPVNFGRSFSAQFFVICKHFCPRNTLGNWKCVIFSPPARCWIVY